MRFNSSPCSRNAFALARTSENPPIESIATETGSALPAKSELRMVTSVELSDRGSNVHATVEYSLSSPIQSRCVCLARSLERRLGRNSRRLPFPSDSATLFKWAVAVREPEASRDVRVNKGLEHTIWGYAEQHRLCDYWQVGIGHRSLWFGFD